VAMTEALQGLEGDGVHLDALRVRAFPFHGDVMDFVARHDRVFVVEQNRDAQLRTLLMVEGGVDPAKLVPVLHYDGTPITARFIHAAVADRAKGGRKPLEVAAE
jgi:2-oxoglutarate/2-oxoacid ferredoxin oxidoreductase subunit alpha